MFENRSRRRAWITTALALGVAVLACSAPAAGGETPTATLDVASPTVEAPTSAPQESPTSAASPVPQGPTATAGASPTTPPTAVPAGPTSTPPTGGGTADYEGISFFFAYAISSKWNVEVIPSQVPGGPENWLIATHYKFTFPSYPVANTTQPARIMIFPVSAWQNYNPEAVNRIGKLQKMLTDKPTTFSDTEGIPVLPVFNAAQVFRAHVSYMTFQNGSGVRFITQYDQAPIPINNGEMFYTFQGVTSDGKYYVAAFFPIAHPSLPADGSNAEAVIGGDFIAYKDGIVQTLEAAKDSSFTPDLATLDYMMGSLRVK
jgi:hypothetical protein